jgi:hypothetical protein
MEAAREELLGRKREQAETLTADDNIASRRVTSRIGANPNAAAQLERARNNTLLDTIVARLKASTPEDREQDVRVMISLIVRISRRGIKMRNLAYFLIYRKPSFTGPSRRRSLLFIILRRIPPAISSGFLFLRL